MSKFGHKVIKLTYHQAVKQFKGVVSTGVDRQEKMIGELSNDPKREAWDEFVQQLVNDGCADESAYDWSYPC